MTVTLPVWIEFNSFDCSIKINDFDDDELEFFTSINIIGMLEGELSTRIWFEFWCNNGSKDFFSFDDGM